jgi:hypothetical protein
MKHATVGRAVLTAAAIGAALMLIISVTKSTGDVSAANASAPPPRTTTPSSDPSPSLATQSTPTTPPPATISPAESQDLADDVEDAVDKDIKTAKVGMEVYDRQSKTVVTSLNDNETFASMSVVKLLIAIDLLSQNDGSMPDSNTQAQITRMLSYSDDAIASSLWMQDGEDSIITRDVQLMGLQATQPPSTPGEWGDTRITARDMVTVYNYLMDQMPSDARDLIYNAMYHAAETAADGTDQYFGIPDGLPGTTWAIKQGWGSSGPNADYNTTGLVGQNSRYVVIVLTSAPLADYSRLSRALTDGTAQLAPLFKSS